MEDNTDIVSGQDRGELVAEVRSELPEEDTLCDLAELFRIFGDSTRIKILYTLFTSDLCVSEIADVLGMTQSAISHQLRILKSSKLVRSSRDGKSIVYSLADGHVREIIGDGLDHVLE